MKVLIAFATKDGQTEAVAERLRARLTDTYDLAVTMFHIEKHIETPALSDFDGIILAASVHMERHEQEMVRFVRDHRAQLDVGKTAFVSVSMSEAGAEREGQSDDKRAEAAENVDKYIQRFFEATEWHAADVFPVAGALMYSKYNIITRWVMKRIAAKTGADTDTSRDHVYTDWNRLDHFADEYVRAHFPQRSALG